MITAPNTTGRETMSQDSDTRVRFNSGYHDATQVVRMGSEDNYGFGPAFTIRVPEDVLDQHPDRAYAGWIYGYYEALGGGSTYTSEYAWASAVDNKERLR